MSDYEQLLEILQKSARVRAAASRAEKLRAWSKPPSQTELEKCQRAERMVRQAIEADPKLSAMNIEVFAKGSFANRTNIPSDSDVDIAVVAKDYYFNDYPDGKGDTDFNFKNSSYTYQEFKADVENAIKNKFGATEVEVGKKSIKVRSNSCRVDADVVPHFVHRRYRAEGGYYDGVALKDSSGNLIHNWPTQDYDNGVSKNEKTGKKYKALARVLKSLCSEVRDAGYASADSAPSYLLACLAWNIPDDFYDEEDFEVLVLAAVDYLIFQTEDASRVSKWVEVNHLKWLFRPTQPWQLNNVHQFLKDIRAHLETL